MIPKALVQDLLARVDIVSVIDGCIPLKRAGANYQACCPFHTERHPSFTVSPAKQFYHCFGCGAHGDAIRFLMEHLGLTFLEAVRDLAQRSGLKVPEPAAPVAAPPGGVAADQLVEVLERAAQFYRAQLRTADAAIAYLKGRGVSGEIAARFQLGYAPADWQSLAAVFPQYDGRALLAAGLVIQNEQGRRYDRFRDRVMFPIHDGRGRIVGFGGRVMGEGEPKYLNSPETPLFEKGRELYGLFLARQAIREAGFALVVEGYMDVVALAQFGIGNAVATLGTATTPAHLQKLLQQTDEVVFSFDGDAAGRKAAWRALENALPVLRDGKQVRFLFLPPEHDPDTYVRAEGADAFRRALRGAQPLSEVLFRELGARADLATLEGRARFVKEARELLDRTEAPVLGMMLRRRAAELAGVGVRELGGRQAAAAPAPQARRAEPGRVPLVRRLAHLLFFDPGLGRLADPALLADLRELRLPDVLVQDLELLARLIDLYAENPDRRDICDVLAGTRLEAAAREAETAAIGLAEDRLEDPAREFGDGWEALRLRAQKVRVLRVAAGTEPAREAQPEQARFLQLRQEPREEPGQPA